jgi:hypothetical protein
MVPLFLPSTGSSPAPHKGHLFKLSSILAIIFSAAGDRALDQVRCLKFADLQFFFLSRCSPILQNKAARLPGRFPFK